MAADILVAEDDGALRLLLSDLLASEGYGVRLAADGIEALEQCRSALPQLLILDLAMPRLDGFAVLDEMGRLGWREQVPVLVLTARQSGCAEVAGLGIECAEKPFDIDDILARVARLAARGAA